MNFCTPGSLKIKLKKNGEIALVLKVSFVCANLEMGGGEGLEKAGQENLVIIMIIIPC